MQHNRQNTIWETENEFIFDETQLCHYTSPTALQNILKYGTLRFSDYRFLNDKTEGTYIFDVIESLDLSMYHESFQDALQGIQTRRYIPNEIIAQIRSGIPTPKTYHLGVDYYYLICCLSTDSNNLAMWNCYTKTANGMGYNIVLHAGNLQSCFAQTLSEACSQSTIAIKKVVYDRSSQERIIRKVLDHYYQNWDSPNNQESLVNNLRRDIHELRVYIKNPCFALEKEVRAVIKMPANEYYRVLTPTGQINVYERDGYYVPYMDLHFGNEEDLARITISPKGEHPFTNQSVSVLLSKYGYSNTEITNSDIPLR